MNLYLAGLTAVVTGGSSGIGAAIVRVLAEEGCNVAFCARKLRRAVKWVADRSEEFVSSTHGRDLQSHAELALDDSGKILALRLASLANVGAYPTGAGAAIQLLIGPWVQTSVAGPAVSGASRRDTSRSRVSSRCRAAARASS